MDKMQWSRWLVVVLAFSVGMWIASDSAKARIDHYPMVETGLTAICAEQPPYSGKGGAARLVERGEPSRVIYHDLYGSFGEGISPWRVADQCFSEGVRVGLQTLGCALVDAFAGQPSDKVTFHVVRIEAGQATQEIPITEVSIRVSYDEGLSREQVLLEETFKEGSC